MNKNMDASITSIRERKKAEASVNQQLTMTSANNLALMLDNVMKQMQESLAKMNGKGDQDKNGPPKPSLSELQKQLNQQIRELSQSEKSGRELSEELAKLAAEQERLRKALEEADKKYGNKPGESEKLMKEMEQTELELVNKNITRQTLRRQEQILTRLLEAEKSMRERELDERREAKSATQYEKMLPKAFEDYIKQREKEIELLKTVPPRLIPFFKMEVNKYFERIKQQENDINN
jgi:chromosome segregation ATPase